MEKFISRSINIIFCLMFTFIIIGSLLIKNRFFEPNNQFFIFLVLIFWLIIFFFLFKKLNKDFKHKKIIVCTIFLIFFIIQLIVSNELKVTPSWDLGRSFDAASNYALTNDGDLFNVYPNNYFLTYVLALLYKLSLFFGNTDFLTLSIVFNIIVIDLSIFIIYLCVKKLKGFNAALFALLMCLFSTPFLFYTPIFYSDTLTMFIPILMFYLVININENNKSILLLILFGILTFIGYKLKASILVFTCAVIIYWLFKNNKLRNIGIVFLTLILCILTFNGLEKKLLPNLDTKFNFPYTHWVMMGLNDQNQIYGSYYFPDVKYTMESNNKTKDNLDVIKKRIIDRKIIGNLDFYRTKILDAWSDGTYFVPEKLQRQPENKSIIHEFVLKKGKYFDYFFYISTGFVLAMYVIMLSGCILDLKNNLDEKTLLRCSLLGIMLFLILWENRSRYLVNFVPIMIVLSTLSLNTIILSFKEKRGKA